MRRASRADASGGPTGYMFRAKARGFIAWGTKTWGREQHAFGAMPPHVSVTSHGARVASQHSPILQAGRGRITNLTKNSSWKYQGVGNLRSKKSLNHS